MIFEKLKQHIFLKINLKIAFIFLMAFVCVQCLSFNKKIKWDEIKSTFRDINSVALSCSTKQNGAVVIMYHRFDGLYSDTSVTEEQFKQHLHFFRSNKFNIVPLSLVVEAIKTGKSLPPKTLAITIDDAYKSTYKQAHPLFVRYNIPYTVFVNTKGIDRGLRDYMTWDQLRSISQSGLASLEAHSHNHAYMIRSFNSKQREKDVKTSVTRIYKEIGHFPKYFAYPYGETNKQFIQELKNYNWNIEGKTFRFSAAFNTQSGPAGCSSNLFALPRFALNIKYGKFQDLFRSKMNSRHFPVRSFYPDDLAFCASEKKQKFSISSYPGVNLNALQCFATNGGSSIQIKNQNQADIILNTPFTKGLRQRINCSVPAGPTHFFGLEKSFQF